MTTERGFDTLLRSWFDESAPSGQPDSLLESVLTATARSRPRPAWQVRLGGEPMSESSRSRLNRFAPLVLAGTAIFVAVLVGIAFFMRPARDVGPSPLPGPTHDATPTPAQTSGRVVFGRYDRFVGNYVVYLIDPNGTNESQLLPDGHQCPRWSPDGKDIAMTPGGVFKNAGQRNGSYQAFSFPDPTLTLGCATWSPNGNRLASEGWDDTDPSRNGIYTVSAVDGGDLQRLTSSPDAAHDIPGDYTADGSLLFFTRASASEHGFVSGLLMVVGMDGSDPLQLTSEPYGVPSLSPDGKSLVAVGEGVLYLIAADGSSVTRVTRPQGTALDSGAYPRVASAPSWSPDGSWIVFSFADRGGEGNIARVRPDGSGFFQITTDAAQETFPDWAP